ncbi:MAG TPA: glycosyltransferase family 39 protein [Anaerolineae bacterium]|nr:glycosyltransferase family 39 protein [Anaerolineae bacterium]
MRKQLEALSAAFDRRWPGWASACVAGLTLLAFVLRLNDLGRWDLTFDEAASIWIARKPPPEMIRYLLGAFHEHPPFYYLSLWAWTQATGQSEYALRFWSVLAGVLSVPLIYAWLRRLVDRGTGLLAALLLTLSAFHIYYSQDARMYALIGTLALLSLICLDRILKDGRRRWWIGWGVVTLIGLSTHYFMGLINAVETVFLLVTWRHNRRALKPWLAIHFGVAALIAVWVLASPGLQTTLGNLGVSGRSEPLIRTLRVLAFDVIFSPVSRLGHEWLWAMLIMAAIGLVISIGARHDAARARAGWLIAALTLVPPFLVLLTPEALYSRYVLFIVFGFVAAVSIALMQASRSLPLLGLALTLVVAWTAVSRYAHQYPTPKSVYGDVIETIRSSWQPGDALILNGPWQWVQLDYYRPGDVPLFFLPPQTPPALDPLETQPILESIARDYRRVWVVQAAVPIADPNAFVVRWLNENAFPADRRGDLSLFFIRKETVRVQPIGVAVDDTLELREAVVPQDSVQTGDAILVALHWRVLRPPAEDLVASLALVGSDDTTWAERVYRPGDVFAPPETWAAGQVIIDRQALIVPVDTPPGDYLLRTNIRRAATGSALMPPDAEGDPWIALARVTIARSQVASTD